MSLCDIYVRDKYSGKIHCIGDDIHDSLWVDENGTLFYHNMQNGDGCMGYHSVNQDKTVDNPDEYQFGYELVPMMDGKLAEPYASQYKEQQKKAEDRLWNNMIKELKEHHNQLDHKNEIPDDL